MSAYAAALQFISVIAGVFTAVQEVKGGAPASDSVPLSVNGVQGDLTVAWVPRVTDKSQLPTSL